MNVDQMNQAEIFEMLEGKGFQPFVDRLRYVLECIQDDPEERPLKLQSLREFAKWLADYEVLTSDMQISIFDGLIHVEWHLNTASALMKFRLDGKIRFAATHTVRKGMQDTDTKENASRTVQDYLLLGT